MSIAERAVPSTEETIDGFLEAFNANDLDRVMSYFADDAVYRPGTGVERVGRAAIRAEFEPQFHYALGAMRWDETDRVVDERARKVAVSWTCRHDLAHVRPLTLGNRLRRALYRAMVGGRFGWEGVDVFQLDGAGKIKSKCSYAGFRRPRLERSLGVALPGPEERG